MARGKSLGVVSLVAIAACGLSDVVHACPICFQAEDHALSAGVRAAVGVLFLVTAAVIGAIGTFAMRLVRAEASAEPGRPVPERPVPL